MLEQPIATPEDFFEFTTNRREVPTGTDVDALIVLLRRASKRVRRALRIARYRAATDGLPHLDAQRLAVVEAVCATATYLEQTGDDGSGAVGEFDTFSAAGVTLAKRGGRRSASENAPASSASNLPIEAREILATAGLFSTIVSSR